MQHELLDPTTRALFIGSTGAIYPDTLVCSGIVPAELDGQPCPHAKDGHMPNLQPLDANDPAYSIDKGQPGDLCPPCAKQQLANLGHWQGHNGQRFPAELLPLRVFKSHLANTSLTHVVRSSGQNSTRSARRQIALQCAPSSTVSAKWK
jgi:hypothetical protein